MPSDRPDVAAATTTIALAGDVMIGRGIDQILQHPGDGLLHEPYVQDAGEYVRLAERRNGPIPRGADARYVWGDALEELERAAPDVLLINLETSITASDAWERKGINYRMHPDNAGCLRAFPVSCCALANNHVLDWGGPGLADTLRLLRAAGIRTAGAGETMDEAAAPAAIPLRGAGRLLVASFGTESSGIPRAWSAGPARMGVHLLADLSGSTVEGIAARLRGVRRPGDLVAASIHWGGNWGYDVPREHRRFAHALVDEAGVDLVHGHSSHHPVGIEVHRERPILYGAGDLLNDYEGIGGMEGFRGDLSLLYLASLHADGRLAALRMIPLRIRRFRLQRAAPEEAEWLQQTLDRECALLGSRVTLDADGRLSLHGGRAGGLVGGTAP